MRNEEWGMRNTGPAVISKKISCSLCNKAERRGSHVKSERWKVRIIMMRIFIYQPVENDTLVVANIIVTLITCKSTVLVNFIKQKLGKTDR